MQVGAFFSSPEGYGQVNRIPGQKVILLTVGAPL